MSYTVADLNAAVENKDTDWRGDWAQFSWICRRNPVTIPGIGSVKLLADETDTDEYSGRIYIVFKVSTANTERAFRRDGVYRSHYGQDWDYGTTEEVESRQEVVTVWRAIGES